MLVYSITAQRSFLHVSTILGVDSASIAANSAAAARLPFVNGVYTFVGGGAPTTRGQSYDRGVHRYR